MSARSFVIGGMGSFIYSYILLLLFSIQVSLFEHIDKQEEKGKKQRTENDTHESEKRKADDHSEDSDKRMNVRHFLLDNKTYQVIKL